MTEGISDHLSAPANDNQDPLGRADTGLFEMYRLRREALKCDLSGLTFDQRRGYWDAVERLNKAIRLYLSCL
jgi:hypothetical protein